MTEDSVGEIHTDAITSWARTHIVPNNATLIVTGDFDPDLVKQHIAYDVGHVSGGTAPTHAETHATARAKWVRGVTARPTPTLAFDLEFLGSPGLDSEHAKRLVLERVLDAQLARLRSRDAVTYGFSASYTARRDGGVWEISGEADATRAAAAATAIVKIFSELRSDPESYRAAFVLSRQRVLEELIVSSASSNVIAGRIASSKLYDLPSDFYENLASDVARLTLNDLRDFIASELPLDHQVFGVFGNEQPVDEALHAASAR